DPAAQPDPVAGRYLPPGSVRVPIALADGRTLLAERAAREGGEVVLSRLGETVRLPAERVVNLPAEGGVPAPLRFPLGTDRFSRDLWSRLLHGARVSLIVGMLAALVAVGLGVLVGTLAAAGGRWGDAVLMRLVDAALAFPRIFLLLAIVAFFRPGVWALVAVLGASGWMGVARLVRSELVALGRRDMALAARAVGRHPLAVLVVHLLPNALAPVLVALGLLIANVVIVESSLSFLGLGVPAPAPSWGNMIAEGSDALLDAWWVATFPGIALTVTVLAFNLLADGLRDLADPRRARR
ncbi:MAG TPA: ABC transporter permease, partial [Thermoanaerobaculia bacterium]|nr:ABC transporter permease [Thermoanaerobaculia bacterium]